MGTFNFRAAGEITFGAGSVGDAGGIVKRHGGKRILMVVDSGFAKAGMLEKITEALQNEKLPFVLFDGVEPEPRVEVADRCGELAKIGRAHV